MAGMGFAPCRRTYMPVLKSLSFTALPKSGNDPVQMRRAKFAAKLEEQKLLLRPQSRPDRPAMDQGERREAGRHQAASRPALVEDGPDRADRHVHQVRGQAHRVREGQGGHRGPVQGIISWCIFAPWCASGIADSLE